MNIEFRAYVQKRTGLGRGDVDELCDLLYEHSGYGGFVVRDGGYDEFVELGGQQWLNTNQWAKVLALVTKNATGLAVEARCVEENTGPQQLWAHNGRVAYALPPMSWNLPAHVFPVHRADAYPQFADRDASWVTLKGDPIPPSDKED